MIRGVKAGTVDDFLQRAPVLLHICRIGMRNVWKYENVGRKALHDIINLDQLKGFEMAIMAHSEEGNSDELYDMYFSLNRHYIKSIMALTHMTERSRDSEEVRCAIVGIGKQLGYPNCCAESFSRLSNHEKNDDWGRVIRQRVEIEGEVDPVFCPFHGPMNAFDNYTPCSLSCSETRNRMRETISAISLLDTEIRSHYSIHKNPVAMFRDKGTFIEFSFHTFNGNHNIYRPTVGYSRNADFLDKLESKCLALNQDEFFLLDEQGAHFLCKDLLFLWWYKRAFSLDDKISAIDGVFSGKNTVVETSKNTPEESCFSEKLNILYFWFCKPGRVISGWHVKRCNRDNVHVKVELEKGQECFILLIYEQNNSEREIFLGNERYSLQYHRDTPIDTESKMRVSKVILEIATAIL
jgi:hypothetical protein